MALRVFNLLQKIGTICLHPARSVSNGCAQEAHSKPVSFKFDTTNSESAREDAPDHLNRLDTKPVIVGLLRTNASIASALNHDRCLAASHNAHESFIRCTERFSAKKALPDILSNGNATGEALAIESAEGTESECERLKGMYSPH